MYLTISLHLGSLTAVTGGHNFTLVLHGYGILVDVPQSHQSPSVQTHMCVCPQPVLKSLFWLESQANFTVLRTLSLCSLKNAFA